MSSERKYPSELDQIAISYARVAARASALAELEREITGHLERSAVFSILVADTVIAENYADPSACLTWLSASHRSWLRSNEHFNRQVERRVFYRYILLPYPSLIDNRQKRQRLRELILLHLHLQLWYGIICGVVFLDPRHTEIRQVLRDLNFVAIPSHRVFLDTPAFYGQEQLSTAILAGDRADQAFKQVTRLLTPKDRAEPIWLHYDEHNFSATRLRGWRWDTLRMFFGQLFGPQLFCTSCNQPMGSFELDHIAPIAGGFPQTIVNFRPLCRRCNREKGGLLGEDPFRLRVLLPTEVETRDLEGIFRNPPPWLGTLQTPTSIRDLTRNTIIRP
jgi:hypothetical protein